MPEDVITVTIGGDDFSFDTTLTQEDAMHLFLELQKQLFPCGTLPIPISPAFPDVYPVLPCRAGTPIEVLIPVTTNICHA